MNFQTIINSIISRVSTDGYTNITVNDHKLLPALINDGPRKRIFNFFVLIGILIGFLIALIFLVMFLVNDVLLFNSSLYSNSQGTLIIEQPFNRTYYLYLFNTAERWSDTGIQINKGDRIRITASGGYFTDIYDQRKHAQNNTNPTDHLITFRNIKTVKQHNATKKFREKPDAPFGALLYEISPEVVVRNDTLRADSAACHFSSDSSEFKAGKSGILRLCVNDVYLTDETIRQLWSNDTTRQLLLNKLSEDSAAKRDSASVCAMYKGLKSAWFDDNNGELLVAVRVDGAPNSISTYILGTLGRIIDDGPDDWQDWLAITAVAIVLIVLISLTRRLTCADKATTEAAICHGSAPESDHASMAHDGNTEQACTDNDNAL